MSSLNSKCLLSGTVKVMGQVVSHISLLMIIVVGLFFTPVSAAEKQLFPGFENEQLSLKLIPRSTEQMAAFYEARGFPVEMIQHLSGYCFFTVIIENKMNQQLWLDLGSWDFSTGQQDLVRIPRSKWPPIWQKLRVPQASQSTFRWTLLPEALRFYANESEGGNIILQKTNMSFDLRAGFAVGDENVPLPVTVNNLRCADAIEASQ